MKIVALCIIFVSFTAIALINLNYFRQRVRLFDDLISFFNLYINEISFNKSDYSTIVNTYSAKFCVSAELLLLNHLDVSKYPNNLRDEEKKELHIIFDSLGKHDLDTEVGVCEIAKAKIEEMRDKAVKESKTKGDLRTKLIFVFGLILLIIIM